MTRRPVRGVPRLAALAALGAALLASLPAFGAAAGSSSSLATDVVRPDDRAAPSAAAALRPTNRCTRYAAPTGRDDNPGTRIRPFKTAWRLGKSLRAGGTGCLRGGVYDDVNDGYVLRVKASGTVRAPITIRSYPGERARLVGIVTVLAGADHVTLSGLSIEGTGDHNTVKIYGDDIVVQNGDITNAGRGKSCMILGSNSGSGQAARTIVRGNRFHDCGTGDDSLEHAIYASNTVGARIVRNVFWNTAGYSIHLYPNAHGSYIARNVIDGGGRSSRGGIVFGGDDDYASSDNVVEQNIIAFARTHNITSNWDDAVARGNVARRNCVWGAKEGNIDESEGGFRAENNTVAPPGFVNREHRNYRLATSSRCRRVLS